MSDPRSISSQSQNASAKEGSNSASGSGTAAPIEGPPGVPCMHEALHPRGSNSESDPDSAGSLTRHHLPQVEDYPSFNFLIGGVTGVGKSALTYNMTLKGDGGVDSFEAATTEVQTFANRLSIIPDPRPNAAPGSKIAVNLGDLVGLCDAARARSVEVNVNQSMYHGWRHLQYLHCMVLLVKKGRDFEGNQEQMLQLIKAFKARGLTNAHFFVVLTHVDNSSEAEVLAFKKELLQTSYAKELNLVSTDAILSGVTQDYRKITNHANFALAEATCRNILLHVLRDDAPPPARFKDSVSEFSQTLDYCGRKLRRWSPPLPAVNVKMSLNNWIMTLLSLLVLLLGTLVLRAPGGSSVPGGNLALFEMGPAFFKSLTGYLSLPSLRSPFSFK